MSRQSLIKKFNRQSSNRKFYLFLIISNSLNQIGSLHQNPIPTLSTG